MNESTVRPGTPGAWILAVRPKTLPAAAAPVILGVAVAALETSVRWDLALACLAVALVLQIAANLANDYFDARSGVDQPGRLGPLRVTHAGLLSPDAVLAGLSLCLSVGTLIGMWVATVVGWWLLGLGAACLAGAVAYTAGPLPLARLGLGEAAALVFFGPVATTGTFAVLAGWPTGVAWLAGLIPGLHAAAIMATNNLRDLHSDAGAGKHTLAVRLGERGARRLPLALVLVGNLLAGPVAWLADRPLAAAALALVPLSWPLLRSYLRTPISPTLNEVLARTGRWELATSLVVAVALHAGALM
ncbi:1,4-dihydroxy-2-naphthoate octaprenyltransferase [bacterium]|nr:1,4-dihydroxy-2-naphthoate octaprenyltransferase [bacterium]